MQINLTGHHVEITPALRTYVTSKLARLERHFENLIDIHCILTVEKLRHRAEATVNLKGTTLFADATEEDMYKSIDLMLDKLDRQVRRHKGKITDHHATETIRRDVP
jgi:putative sigma-54 modulation protein